MGLLSRSRKPVVSSKEKIELRDVLREQADALARIVVLEKRRDVMTIREREGRV